MLQHVLKRIEARLLAVGLSATAASKAAGLSADAIRNIRRGVADGREGVNSRTVEALAPVLQTTSAWLISGEGDESISDDLSRKIEVVGMIGAGSATCLFALGQGKIDEVNPPRLSRETVSAAIIQGESLGPFFNGWTVFYDRIRRPASQRDLGDLCIIGLADERILLKKLTKGTKEGHWTLLSQFEPPIYDVVVDWVAPIIMICPYTD